jgi:hypothetical protein
MHGYGVAEMLLLTAPMERNNKVSVIEVVWSGKED